MSQSHYSKWFQVNNSSNGELVSFASIIDRTQNIQYITDESGYIELDLADSTLIKISAIGFHPFYYLSDQKSDTIFIPLLPKIYDLKEFTISPWSTIALFKKAFEDFELEDSNVLEINLAPIYLLSPKKHIRSQYSSQELVSFSFSSPISGFYNLYSKKAKSLRMLHQLQGKDKRTQLVYKKYNSQLVQSITGIKETEKLKRVMEFCRPSESFILSASDYELVVFIIDCYQDFLAMEE